MTAPRSISFAGCRTRAEARARFEAWIAEIRRDNLHRLRTDLFAARDNGEIIDDDVPDEIVTTVDDVVAMARQQREDALRDTLAHFDHVFAEHLRSDIP